MSESQESAESAGFAGFAERASLHAWCSQLFQSRFAARQWSYACTSSWISAVSISCRDPSRLWQITTCTTGSLTLTRYGRLPLRQKQ